MSDIEIIVVTHDWDRFAEVLDLAFEVLYKDYDVRRDDEWYHPANGSEFAVALDKHGAILGAARILPAPGDPSRQIRQVMVAPHTHRRGVGRMLMGKLEDIARREGAQELWLNARHTAFGFYHRVGFEFDGPVFISELTRIPHRRMRKVLK